MINVEALIHRLSKVSFVWAQELHSRCVDTKDYLSKREETVQKDLKIPVDDKIMLYVEELPALSDYHRTVLSMLVDELSSKPHPELFVEFLEADRDMTVFSELAPSGDYLTKMAHIKKLINKYNETHNAKILGGEILKRIQDLSLPRNKLDAFVREVVKERLTKYDPMIETTQEVLSQYLFDTARLYSLDQHKPIKP